VTPVNGSCGSTANTCSAGDYDASPADTSTQYLWTCNGQNGGSNASCSKTKPVTPVNGSCGSTANTCSAGDYDASPADTSTQYLWTCNGQNGGSDASCTKAKPVNGSCGSTANTCSTGDYDSDPADSSTEYKWTCTGKNGGTDKSCTKAKAVNGQCGSNKNTCVKGTVDNTSSTATHDLWDCKGSGGGTTDSCSKVKSSSYSWVKETTLGCSPSGFSQCSTHWEWQCQNTSGNQVSSTNCSGAAPNPSSGIDSCHCGTLGGGGGCFVPETFITMHDGTLKPVIEVKVGERVKSPQGYNTVLKKHVYDHTGKLFGVNDSENFVTGSHPIYTVEGWKAFEPVKAKQLNPELDIQQLSLGDVIVTDKGHVTLNKITHIPVQGLKVYNLRLDGSQEYYADGFVVHNK
ncbi:MAG: Hint domain-containing protein, partial [Pseudomonadota bacterium]|nr:Hint domain-containing protein [Pseudomonadota bacterium]